ncbi:MAG: hypothetical protein ACRDIA_02990 [Actinomycetota bacterium]
MTRDEMIRKILRIRTLEDIDEVERDMQAFADDEVVMSFWEGIIMMEQALKLPPGTKMGEG